MVSLLSTGDGVSIATEVDGDWRVERTLEDERVNCLLVHPADPTVVYAGTQGTGVWRSADAGRHWEQWGLDDAIVKSLAASVADPDRLYAGTKPPLVYRSDDAGSTWRELSSFREIPWRRLWFSPAEPPYSAYVQGLAVSPEDPDVVLAGIEFGAVVRSDDGGETWGRHVKGAIRDCHTLAFHAEDGDYVYEAGAGWGGAGAWSRDSGATWERPARGLDRMYGWAVASDPTDPEQWYVSASTGASNAHSADNAKAFVYRYIGDESWERLAGGLPQPLDCMPYAICPDPETPGSLYLGLSNGDLWHSADFGDIWEQLPVSVPAVERAMVLLS